ncbi:MAG TPA: hypothetical protein VM406_04780 [Noviherbaspirillum sp.]|nr:hypothetical protein [Noviherbaspirillum sp.]
MLEVNVKLAGHTALDFDKKKMRRALRQIGGGVRKEARRLVARRAVSQPGQDPGRDSGTLSRSIKVKVFSSGMGAVVSPQKTAEMGDAFYPAFLVYGVRRDAKRRKDHQRQVDNGKGWRMAPRNDFMMSAQFKRSDVSKAALMEALKDALKPR